MDTLTPRAYFATLGCPKNETDSESMAARLQHAGYRLVDDPSSADIVFVNTCSFIQAATEESIDAVLDLVEDDRIKADSVPVVVCGCMPSRYGAELEGEFEDVAAFLPCASEDDVVAVADRCLGIERDATVPSAIQGEGGQRRLDEPSRVSAYVKVSDGCSRGCAYCTIPRIRGPYRSRSYDAIAEEVGGLVLSGVREIVLIGQDTGIWGRDLDGDQCLAGLLRDIAAAYPDTWFRIMYTQPESIDDELLSVISRTANVCSYLDIPMQHCSSAVLARMGRCGSYDEMMGLVAHIRDVIPAVAIRTTLMAGFPGETEDEFEELLRFVEEAAFDYAGVFAFSPEEGTRACSMDGQVDEDERLWRAERVRTVADAVSSQVIAERIGSAVRVLVEGVEEDGQRWGRTMGQAPEVDGVTYVGDGSLGEMVDGVVDDTLMYDMEVVSDGR